MRKRVTLALAKATVRLPAAADVAMVVFVDLVMMENLVVLRTPAKKVRAVSTMLALLV